MHGTTELFEVLNSASIAILYLSMLRRSITEFPALDADTSSSERPPLGEEGPPGSYVSQT